MKNNQSPWYERTDYWIKKADSYIDAARQLSEPDLRQKALESFLDLNVARVIFESNLIEGAGLTTEGQTRQVLKDFPSIPNRIDMFMAKRLPVMFNEIISMDVLKRMARSMMSHGMKPENMHLSITMENKSRQYVEVVRHYFAMMEAQSQTMEFLNKLFIRILHLMKKENHLSADEFESIIERLNIEIDSQDEDKSLAEPNPILFSESGIKKIHELISEDLLPSEALVGPGEYRIDDRIVGWDISFPAPNLVPYCMEKFIERSNEYLRKSFTKELNKYEAAARISYEFVEIHPFPDFNGRVSRILMNMVLIANSCPFPISIRGQKKERRKYFYALRKANRGDIMRLTTLIAMRTAEKFEELERHFNLAGLNPLVPSDEA